ncbi:MAG TPA: YigZ family protein [Thermoanaerobaculia bacterium]|nr:YigZ family protein [Thermoanaerobaculia bacterium]
MPTASAEASLRELGSRFFAFVAPAASIEAAKAAVAALQKRYPDATHVCFAWRVGWPAAERAADAGEPAGTAGPPILQALRSAGLTDVVAAVVRYFGGTQLGKGGLVRAYGGVVRAALAGLPARAERARVALEVRAAYERIGALKRLVRPGTIELASETYDERALLLFAVALEARAGFEAALAELGLEAREVAAAS